MLSGQCKNKSKIRAFFKEQVQNSSILPKIGPKSKQFLKNGSEIQAFFKEWVQNSKVRLRTGPRSECSSKNGSGLD